MNEKNHNIATSYTNAEEDTSVSIYNTETSESKTLSEEDYEINASTLTLAKPVGDFFTSNIEEV